MKHFGIILATMLMSMSVQAKQHQSVDVESKQAIAKPHSMAIMFGSVDGVSYRFFVDKHWAIQTILMWKYLSTYGTTVTNLTTDELGEPQSSRTSQWGKLHGWTTEVNPNFIHQTTIRDWDWGSLYWNSGAGISVGLAQDWKLPDDYPLWGKTGVNAISGFELSFSKHPISIFTESFVGYGLLWNSHKNQLNSITTLTQSTNHFIDWGSDIGIRYAF